MPDITNELKKQIETAMAEKMPLNIIGGNTKSFYGRAPQGEPLRVGQHSGITSYEPTELVLTARAGTTLEEIEHTLAANNQMLPFEPPHFGAGASIGGTIACNFSGPRRAYAGAARDYVLGTRIINGNAEVLHFGGEVMKNVAGYDVSRLMAGAMGTLGVLLEVSLKVLPKPARELTLVQETRLGAAISKVNQWAGKPVPLSATAYHDGRLYVRLSGAESSVQTARNQIGGEVSDNGDTFWRSLREHNIQLFTDAEKVWRVSVPQNAPPLELSGEWLIEWGGGLRWLITEESAQRIREVARAAGGHATLFRGGDREQEVFQALDDVSLQLHRNLKRAFDPHHLFNPGRLYGSL